MNWLTIFGIGVQIIIIIAGHALVQSLKAIPTTIADKLRQNRDFDMKQALQTDSFFRTSGNSVLQSVMSQWTVYVTDLEILKKINTTNGQKQMNKLIEQTIGYGSERTINLLAELFQMAYTNDDDTEHGLKMWVVMAMIVASLKKDFAGVEIDPLTIIKIRSNDYLDNQDKFEAYQKEIEKKVG